jgi:hypothetical protein
MLTANHANPPTVPVTVPVANARIGIRERCAVAASIVAWNASNSTVTKLRTIVTLRTLPGSWRSSRSLEISANARNT